MKLDRSFGGGQFAGNLLVEQSCHQKGEHFAFAGCKQIVTIMQFGHLHPLLEHRPISLEGCLNGAEQLSSAEWLGQELHRSTLHCTHGHWDITMCRHEDNGELDSRIS